jgi:hypothetical protein
LPSSSAQHDIASDVARARAMLSAARAVAIERDRLLALADRRLEQAQAARTRFAPHPRFCNAA